MKKDEEMKKVFNNINKQLDRYFSPNGKKIFVGLICIALVAIVFLGFSFAGNKQAEMPGVAELPPLGDVNVPPDENVAEIDVDDIGESEDKMVSLSVEDSGRSNPFLPEGESFSGSRKDGLDLMAPPENITEGTQAAKVVSTKVSGIMYEANSPSAILNIEGSDYLVRSGDKINSYKVLSIGKDLVTVQLGPNIYKAGVGQMLTNAEVNYNNVYNLQNRFGGAKRR